MIDALQRYYESENANIHRGVHTLSREATEAYEQARNKIAHFINAAEPREIIFTRGTTEGINLVATSYGGKFLKAGDEIILSAMEHHSNIVPWQLLAERIGAKIRVIPMNDRGELSMDDFDRLLSDRTKIVSIAHLSNSLGTINPVRQIIEKAHARGAVVVIDGRSGSRMLRWTCVNWTRISTRFQDISCTAQPGSESCTGKPPCWKRCPRIRAAGT